MKRKSYFVNFPTNSLFTLMEQSVKEIEQLEIKLVTNYNPLLVERIKQVQLVLDVSRNVIIERYLEEGVSLSKIAKFLIMSDGVKLSVYKELFTLKILETDEIISLDLLKGAIDKLDLSDLMMIIRTKENTVYKELALKKYDEMIFDVEPEVYQDYVKKKRLDRKKDR